MFQSLECKCSYKHEKAIKSWEKVDFSVENNIYSVYSKMFRPYQ